MIDTLPLEENKEINIVNLDLYEEELRQSLKDYNLPFSLEAVVRKSTMYYKYLTNTQINGCIKAEMLIISSLSNEPEVFKTWGKYTKENIKIYPGYGVHSNMLNTESVKQNATVINRLL